MKNTQNDIRYIIYARRSIEKTDKEDKVVSIESQIKECRDIAVEHGFNVVKTLQEAKSAKEPYRRVEFQKMIEMIQKGQADGILCWKMDRLARNAVDEGTIKYLLQKGIIRNVKSTDRDWYPDDNVLLASVEFGVATQYSRDLSKHIKRGLRARLESGVRPSIAPLGYKNSKYHEKGKEEILVDEERFPLVRKVFDLMLTGAYNPFELTRIANETIGLTNKHAYAGTKINKTNMYRILINPFYYGVFEFPAGSGEWYQGKHKQMITKDEYDKVQFLLGRAGKAKPKTHSFAFTGMIRCGFCGACITAEEKFKHQQNGNVHRYVYYHCTKRIDANCQEKAVREEVLDKEILEFLARIEIPKLFHEWAIETLKDMHENEKVDRNSVIATRRSEYDKVVSRLDKLLEIRMANEITAENYQQKKSELEQQKLVLSVFLNDVDQRISNWLKDVEACLSFAEKARTEFASGDSIRKKELFGVLGYNHTLKDGKLSIATQKPLLIIEKAANLAKSISDRLEPPKSLAEQGRIKQKYSKNDQMWRWAESNRRAINVRRTNLRC